MKVRSRLDRTELRMFEPVPGIVPVPVLPGPRAGLRLSKMNRPLGARCAAMVKRGSLIVARQKDRTHAP